MPTFAIESPQTGQKYQVQFDREPSPEDLDFAAKQFDNEWWQQQGIEPGSAITQQTPLETVGSAIANVGPTLAGMVGGGMRYLDKAAQVVADVTGTERGGLFGDIARQAEGIQAEGDVLRPLSPANPTAQMIGQGMAQGIGMLGTAAASVPALGARGMMAVPAALGFGAGGGEGVQQGEAMGLSPMGQLAQGTAFGAAEAATEMLGGIGGRFLPPARSVLGRMAGGVASETIEEPAAGALQEAITNVAGLAVADPQRPGFTTTGFQLPGPAGYLERRGQEAIGGAAGGLVFAGVQPLMRGPGVGQPLSEAPAVAPDAVPESTGDLTAEDVADLEPQPMPRREAILTGVPDRMARVRENALNTEPVMEGDVITDLRVPRSPEAIAESQRIENERLAQEAKLRAQDAKARGMPMVADSPTGSRDIVDWANENPIYLPPGFSAERKNAEYDALQRNPLPPYWRQFVASSKQGGNPDSIAQRAFDAGLIAEPTPDAYLQALQEGIAGRQQYRVQFAQRDKALAQEEKRVIDFEKSQNKLAKRKDTQQVTFEDIVPGDEMTIDGEPAVVRNVEYNEDGYLTNVVIEDGKRFGLMQFDPQTRGGLLVDEFKPASQPFAPAATQDQPQTITGSNEQTGSEMPVPPPTAAAGAGAGGVTRPSSAASRPATAARKAPPASVGGGQGVASGGGAGASQTVAPAAGEVNLEDVNAELQLAGGFTNLDVSGRTAGFLNTEILSEAEALVRRGVRSFAQWSQAMVRRFGKAIRAYLTGVWDNVRRNSELGAVMNPLARGPLRAPESGMASASGAAQANEPSPGGLSEAEVKMWDRIQKIVTDNRLPPQGNLMGSDPFSETWRELINAKFRLVEVSRYRTGQTRVKPEAVERFVKQSVKWAQGHLKRAEDGFKTALVKTGQEELGKGFRLLHKVTRTPWGSRYYDFDYKGQLWHVRIADHANTADRQGMDDFAMARHHTRTGMDFPHRINIVLSKPATSDNESLRYAKDAVTKMLDSLSLQPADAGSYFYLLGKGVNNEVVFDSDSLDEVRERIAEYRKEEKSQSRAESGSDMLGRGPTNLATSKTGQGDSQQIQREVNPESSGAAGGTQGFKNLDTSGRTAGFLNTEILSEARQLIADGFTTFANWSQAMVTRFGRGIREFLQSIWQQITSPQTNAAQNVRLGMPQGNAPVSIGAGGFVGGGQASNIPEGQDVTRSRFASPDEAKNLYDIQATETMRAESAAWLEANGIEPALAAMEANSPPDGLRIDHLPSLGAQVITRLAKLAETGTEAQRIQADVLLERASRAWHGKMSQEAGRTLQQRNMATDELRGIASILTTKDLLVERADRVVKERFEGGAEGAVQQVKDIDAKVSTQAGEELAAQLEGEPDAPELGDNPEVVPVNDSRVAELEKQMQDLREQMVREQTQAESTLAQTTSTWQKIMGVLQAAGGRKSSLLTGAKGKLAALRKAALARKAARRAEGRLSANPVEDFADDAIIGAAILAEGLVEFTNWSQAVLREVGFRSGQDLRRLYEEASKKYLEALEAEKAAPTKAKGTPKQRQAREKINKAQRTAQNILDSLARRYSDPPIFAEGQRRVNAMRELYKERVKTGMPEVEFVKRAMALGANEGTAGILWEASKLEIDAREMMALEKSRAGLAGYLKKNSPALAKLLDALRKKVAPGMTWAEIFMTLPAEQKARQREIYRRLMLDERLKALNQGERLQLTNELDRAWQRERRKVFVRELEKITGLGKTKKDRDKVKAALPRLLRLMNLGMLNSETFRGAIAQEYGIQQIDAATGAELRKLGEQIQQAPEGLPRRKLEQQLMQRLQNLTGSTMAEVLESWWTASVLSGWRTQMDIALSLANGLEDVTLGSLVTALRTGNGRVAKDALFAMLSNLPTAMNEALDHLITGNRAAMRSYDAEVKAALEDGNKLFGNVGRQLLNKGGMAKLPGAFMEFVSRMMTALDHINSTSTYEGAKAMALARHPELYEKALTISPQDRQAARTQARLELTGGEAPTTRQQRVEETARMKEILDQRVPLEFQAQAREIGLESALQGEPTGLGQFIYKAANNINQAMRQAETAYDQNRPDNAAGKAVMAALRLSSTLVKVLTGTKFVRTVGHSVNRSLSYAPGIGLVRFAEGGMKGAKADILLAKQLMGTAVGLALLMAFRDGEDDEQGIEGSWRELTPQQKGQLLAEGKQPYSIWTRDAQGKIRTWNYQQWGIAGVLATIGAMEDQRRYNSAGKDDLAILMDGIVSGSMAWTDKTQLTGLQMLMGKDQAASSSPSSSLAGALNKWASTTVGGLVPRIFKDVDMVISPQLRDTSEWWMKWAGQVPMVRELSSGKRVNIFGEDIVLDRGPTSRITQVGTLDPALRTLGRLNERDIWLPDPTQGVRMVKLADGSRRKMTTAEKDRYQRATGAAYRQFITEQGANLLRMDPELARETISKVTERLRNQAAYQAVRR